MPTTGTMRYLKIGDATYEVYDTNDDTKVYQSYKAASGYTYWRPLVIGYSSGSAETFTPADQTNLTYTFETLKVQPSSGTIRFNAAALANGSYTNTISADTLTANRTLTAPNKSGTIALTSDISTAIAELPTPMSFKGSVGTGGTITSLPAAAAANEGYTYKVITALTTPVTAKIGDTVISNGSEWVVIPSGDEPSGTVTSVGLANATNGGLTISGSPITSSGNITVGHSNVLSSAQTTQAVYPIKIDKNGHISAYGTAVTVPTKVSDLTNDSGFATLLDVDENLLSTLTIRATDASSKAVLDQMTSGSATIVVPSNLTTFDLLPVNTNPTLWFAWLNGATLELARLSATVNTSTAAITLNLIGKTSIASGVMGVDNSWTVTPISTNSGTITEVKTTTGTHSTIDVTSGIASFNVPTKTSHLTNDSGFITTDENLKWTASTTSNTYYPLVSTSTATTSTANTLNGINFYQYYNTAGGYRRLDLGNSTAYKSSGGAYGTIRLYGAAATYYGDLVPGVLGTTSGDGHISANRTWTLPDKTGTIALTSDITDEKVKRVLYDTETGGTFYPLFSGSNSTQTNTAYMIDGIDIVQYAHTSTQSGFRELNLGNTTNSFSDGGAYGRIKLYGTGSNYGILYPGTIGTASNDGHLSGTREWTLPDKTGTIALTSDIPTVPSYIVNTITTTAGTHIPASYTGDVEFNIPTKTSHLTNDSGFITTYSDENVKSTAVTAATTNYIVGSTTSTTTTGGLSKHASGVLYTTADSGTSGYTQLRLGNTTATSSAGGKEGQIRLYGTNATYYLDLKPGAIASSNKTITFPNATGTVALTSDIPTVPTITLNGSSSTSPSFYAPTGAGTSGYYLKSNGSGAPSWTAFPTIPTITLNGSSTTSPSFYAPTSVGTSGQYLTSNGSGAPSWINFPTIETPFVGEYGVTTYAEVTAALASNKAIFIYDDDNGKKLYQFIGSNSTTGNYYFSRIYASGLSDTIVHIVLDPDGTWYTQAEETTTLSLGSYIALGYLTSTASTLAFSIPTGRIFRSGTTINKITFNVVARAGSSNGTGKYIIRNTSGGSDSAPFDSSTTSKFYNAATTATQKSLTSSMWTVSLVGLSNIYITLAGGSNYFFTGSSTSDSTIGGYCNNQPAAVSLSSIEVTFNLP